jgi:hypothetical protein
MQQNVQFSMLVFQRASITLEHIQPIAKAVAVDKGEPWQLDPKVGRA